MSLTEAHRREAGRTDMKSDSAPRGRGSPRLGGRAHPGPLLPLLLVLHLLLHLVDPLQGLQAFIQQKRRVVDQHVDIANKLLPRAESNNMGPGHTSPSTKTPQVPEERATRVSQHTSPYETLAQLEYRGGQGLQVPPWTVLLFEVNHDELTPVTCWSHLALSGEPVANILEFRGQIPVTA